MVQYIAHVPCLNALGLGFVKRFEGAVGEIRKHGIKNTAEDSSNFEGVSHVLDLSEDSSKLIPIHEESNHQIVHLFRLGKA